MALGDSYATLAELRSRLDINDTIDDARLTMALATASRGIEKETRRQFNSASSASARVYYPSTCHVVEVDDFSTTVGLVVKTDLTDDGSFETTWQAADYQLEPLNGIVDGEIGWPYSLIRSVRTQYFPTVIDPTTYGAPIQVTAQWGWTAVPAPVKEATLILAEDIFKLRDAPFGAGGYSDYGRIKARENPHVLLRIAPYRRNAILVG